MTRDDRVNLLITAILAIVLGISEIGLGTIMLFSLLVVGLLTIKDRTHTK